MTDKGERSGKGQGMTKVWRMFPRCFRKKKRKQGNKEETRALTAETGALKVTPKRKGRNLF